MTVASQQRTKPSTITATKQPPAPPVLEDLGLSAIGSSGRWVVSVDEAGSRRGRKWFLEVDGPSVYVSVAIQSPDVIGKLLTYLQQSARLRGSRAIPSVGFPLGESKDHLVTLWRDDEFPDRCFLVFEAKTKTVVRITIGGEDWHAFVHALTGLHRELLSNASDDQT